MRIKAEDAGSDDEANVTTTTGAMRVGDKIEARYEVRDQCVEIRRNSTRL